MKNKRTLAFSAALFLMFTILFPISQPMEESFTCQVLDQDDETYRDQVTVTFTGTYTDSLLGKDTFKGRIHIDGYEFLDPEASDCELTIGKFEESTIFEYIIKPDGPHTSHMGMLYATEDLESFFMILMVPHEENPGAKRSRYILTYPEMTFDEIYAVLDQNHG